MNNARKAFNAGANVRRVFQTDSKTGKELPQRVNSSRRAKRELNLSGRQLKKLRKIAGREDRAAQRAAEHEALDIMAKGLPPRLVPPHTPGLL